MLTGCASKGRNNYYHYYHCTSACGCRFKASVANALFTEELRKFIPRDEMIPIFKQLIIEEYNDLTKYHRIERNQTLNQIKELNDHLNKARQKLFLEQIEANDFKIMKIDCEKAIDELERRLLGMSSNNPKSIDQLLEKGVSNLMRLDYIYENGTISKKREVIGSIFPENLTFDGINYRTARINEVAKLIYLINNRLDENKKGTSNEIFDLYLNADRTGPQSIVLNTIYLSTKTH